MKELEDKIKDRLEGYESRLPESDLAEFKSLLDKASSTSTGHNATYLAWLLPAATAAGLALFFILRPAPGPDPVQVIDGGAMTAQAADPITVDKNYDASATETKPSAVQTVQHLYSRAADREEVQDRSETVQTTEEQPVEADSCGVESSGNNTNTGSSADNDSVPSAFVPTGITENRKPVGMNVGAATAGIVGGSGAIALAGLLQPVHTTSPVGTIDDPRINAPDEKTATHRMPLRAGLSLRIPVNERWSLTTGVDYSLYSSKIGYKQQRAHYLGIPVRADYSITRNKWLDVYVGAGVSTDFCVAASVDGCKTAKDGIGIALNGAGGVLFSISDHFGLFLEPTFSWNIPSDNRVLDTYKSEHPCMLSVASGLRVSFP